MLKVGCVVRADSGRDKGKYFCVMAIDGDRRFLRDGKSRKIEKPKRKNTKHITITPYKLQPDDLKINSHLKKAIDSLVNL